MLHSKVTSTGKHAIIFVHGNSQSLHTWDAVIASPALDEFAKVAVDLPGCGQSYRSGEPQNDYTLKGLGKNLQDFLLQYKDMPFILVGTSLGTNAIGELIPFPSNCKGVFLLGAMVANRGMELSDLAQPNPAVAVSFDPHPADYLLDDAIANLLPDATDAEKAAYKAEFKSADSNLRAYLGQSVMQKDWSDEITNLNNAGIPVGVVYGTDEKVVVPDYLDRTPLKKWRDEIIMIPRAGHCIQLEQPQALAELLADFAGDCFG